MKYSHAWDDEKVAATLYRETDKGKRPIAYFNREQDLLIIDTHRFDARDLPKYLQAMVRENGIKNKQ